MATLYKSDGTVQAVRPGDGKRFTLVELQGLVGGYIERVPFPDGESLWMNEEGKLRGLPRNDRATAAAHEACAIFPDDFIVGDALLTNKREVR